MAVDSFDIQNFQEEIFNELRLRSASTSINKLEDRDDVANDSRFETYGSSDKTDNETEKSEESQGIEDAQKLVAQKKVKHRICPALQKITDDVFEITKVIVPILVPLSIAGTIAIPLNPVFFASIAIVLCRCGIASYCSIPDSE
jgi:hypothetical protein